MDDLNFAMIGVPDILFHFNLRKLFVLPKPPIDGKWQEVELQQHRA